MSASEKFDNLYTYEYFDYSVNKWIKSDVFCSNKHHTIALSFDFAEKNGFSLSRIIQVNGSFDDCLQPGFNLLERP
jgi:hypothetical protein